MYLKENPSTRKHSKHMSPQMFVKANTSNSATFKLISVIVPNFPFSLHPRLDSIPGNSASLIIIYPDWHRNDKPLSKVFECLVFVSAVNKVLYSVSHPIKLDWFWILERFRSGYLNKVLYINTRNSN